MRPAFFQVGIFHPKHEVNVGTLWRAAYLYGASGIFTVGRRYSRQASDTPGTPNHVPLTHYADMDDLLEHLPHSTPLVGVELDGRAQALSEYTHRPHAAYLLGAEDHGLPPAVLARCHDVVQVEALRPVSHNVAATGSIVLWHRHIQRMVKEKAA